jgi:fumarylacetoacetate (FAA) hydrolase family protein
MTCPECEEDCGLDNECGCDCHDEADKLEAVVMENQSIEFEEDHHLPDGTIIYKTRLVVTGRDTNDAYKQFTRVRLDIKT